MKCFPSALVPPQRLSSALFLLAPSCAVLPGHEPPSSAAACAGELLRLHATLVEFDLQRCAIRHGGLRAIVAALDPTKGKDSMPRSRAVDLSGNPVALDWLGGGRGGSESWLAARPAVLVDRLRLVC